MPEEMPEDAGSDPATRLWDEHRALLFTVAYEILGSAADAEDVVQEVWLRWRQVDLAQVRDGRAYLVTIATRQALNRLRTVQRRREEYVGPWLPEPLRTSGDVADDVALADAVSTAMLLVLDTLGPVERVVFVLHEVFDVPYGEIARSVDRSVEAVRQIAVRARRHVAARRPRQQVQAAERAAVLERFFAAARSGDMQSLVDLLAPDVVLVTDGGGLRPAALRPISGAAKVMRFLLGVWNTEAAITSVTLNGSAGLCFDVGGEIDTVVTLGIHDGLIRDVYVVRNPQKLTAIEVEVPLTRG